MLEAAFATKGDPVVASLDSAAADDVTFGRISAAGLIDVIFGGALCEGLQVILGDRADRANELGSNVAVRINSAGGGNESEPFGAAQIALDSSGGVILQAKGDRYERRLHTKDQISDLSFNGLGGGAFEPIVRGFRQALLQPKLTAASHLLDSTDNLAALIFDKFFRLAKTSGQLRPHGLDFTFDLPTVGRELSLFWPVAEFDMGPVPGYSSDVFFADGNGPIVNTNVKARLIACQQFAVLVEYSPPNRGQKHRRIQHEFLSLVRVVLVGEDLQRNQTGKNNGKQDAENEKEDEKTAIKHFI